MKGRHERDKLRAPTPPCPKREGVLIQGRGKRAGGPHTYPLNLPPYHLLRCFNMTGRALSDRAKASKQRRFKNAKLAAALELWENEQAKPQDVKKKSSMDQNVGGPCGCHREVEG